jgi:hypothetical protein
MTKKGLKRIGYFLKSNVDGNNVYGNNQDDAIDLYGSWHHVVWTWDGTSDATLFYIDGELNKTSHEYAAVIPANFINFTDCQIAPVIIGEMNVGYNGSMAEFAIYNRPLSLTEISTHFANEEEPEPPIANTCTTGGFLCAVPTRHMACWKYINNAWVSAVTVCRQNL